MNVDKTIQLFIDAYNHNWDYGISKIKKILKSPNCDKGTALAIYWLFQPDYYYRLELSAIKGDLKKNYSFITNLEEELVNDLFQEYIKYDPTEIMKSANLSDLKKQIPEKLMIASKGEISYLDILDGKVGIGSWFKAAKKGDLKLLKELYEKEIVLKKKDINIKDQWGLTAFDYLCFSEDIQFFEDVKSCMTFILDNGGKKPKLISVANAKTFAIQKINYFLEIGVNINSKEYGRSALFFANDHKIAEYLLSKKINIHLVAKDGQSALHHLFYKAYRDAHVTNLDVQIAKLCELFLDSGINPNLTDDSDFTVLQCAERARKELQMNLKNMTTNPIILDLRETEQKAIRINKKEKIDELDLAISILKSFKN